MSIQTDNAHPTDEQFRDEQIKNLRAAIDSVLPKLMAAEDAIEGIDDLAMDLDEITGEAPVRFRRGDDPFVDHGGVEDLNLPLFVGQVLTTKPLQMHRAALVVYKDALEQAVTRLHNQQAYLGITDDELGLGAGAHTCGVPSAYEVLSPAGTAWVVRQGLQATSTEEDMLRIADEIIARGDKAYRPASVYDALVLFRDDLRREHAAAAAQASASYDGEQ